MTDDTADLPTTGRAYCRDRYYSLSASFPSPLTLPVDTRGSPVHRDTDPPVEPARAVHAGDMSRTSAFCLRLLALPVLLTGPTSGFSAASPAAAQERPPVVVTRSADTPAVSPTHTRPVSGTVLVPADIPEQNWRPGHRGVDLDARAGDEVRASESGTVRFAGVVAGTPTVSVDHGNGLRTTYEPVIAAVSEGERVIRGQVLGSLADAGTLPDSARKDAGLHWGAVLQTAEFPDSGTAGDGAPGPERYIDPMMLLAPVHVRLWR